MKKKKIWRGDAVPVNSSITIRASNPPDVSTISGVYNRRLSDETLDITTEKSPQEIATLCFEAMGEVHFSVSELPNLSRPQMIFYDVSPASIINGLCEMLGCYIVLGTDDVMRIERSAKPLAQIKHIITDGMVHVPQGRKFTYGPITLRSTM